MERATYIDEDRRDAILASAIDDGIPVVVTRKVNGGWVTTKTRFGGHSDDRQALYIHSPTQVSARAWPELETGELLGVAFRCGHKKCLFNTMVVRPEASKDGPPSLEVRWPTDIQQLQRRAYQRACPPPDRRIRVTVEPAERVGGKLPFVAFDGAAEDLSAGGMRVLCDTDPTLAVDCNVKLSFPLGGKSGTVTVDAAFRHCERKAPDRYSLGFQFVGLETTADGQMLLARIARTVTDFQRAASRRKEGRLRSRRRSG